MTWQTVISTVKSGTECPINRCNMPEIHFSGSVVWFVHCASKKPNSNPSLGIALACGCCGGCRRRRRRRSGSKSLHGELNVASSAISVVGSVCRGLDEMESLGSGWRRSTFFCCDNDNNIMSWPEGNPLLGMLEGVYPSPRLGRPSPLTADSTAILTESNQRKSRTKAA
jgi:hypothetical protein